MAIVEQHFLPARLAHPGTQNTRVPRVGGALPKPQANLTRFHGVFAPLCPFVCKGKRRALLNRPNGIGATSPNPPLRARSKPPPTDFSVSSSASSLTRRTQTICADGYASVRDSSPKRIERLFRLCSQSALNRG